MLSRPKRTQKSRRVLRDLTSVAEYERVYTSRQRTLMQKAFELEEATGAEVTVTVRSPSQGIAYYVTNSALEEKLKQCKLIEDYSRQFTKTYFSSSNAFNPQFCSMLNTANNGSTVRISSNNQSNNRTPDPPHNENVRTSPPSQHQANVSNNPRTSPSGRQGHTATGAGINSSPGGTARSVVQTARTTSTQYPAPKILNTTSNPKKPATSPKEKVKQQTQKTTATGNNGDKVATPPYRKVTRRKNQPGDTHKPPCTPSSGEPTKQPDALPTLQERLRSRIRNTSEMSLDINIEVEKQNVPSRNVEPAEDSSSSSTSDSDSSDSDSTSSDNDSGSESDDSSPSTSSSSSEGPEVPIVPAPSPPRDIKPVVVVTDDMATTNVPLPMPVKPDPHDSVKVHAAEGNEDVPEERNTSQTNQYDFITRLMPQRVNNISCPKCHKVAEEVCGKHVFFDTDDCTARHKVNLQVCKACEPKKKTGKKGAGAARKRKWLKNKRAAKLNKMNKGKTKKPANSAKGNKTPPIKGKNMQPPKPQNQQKAPKDDQTRGVTERSPKVIATSDNESKSAEPKPNQQPKSSAAAPEQHPDSVSKDNENRKPDSESALSTNQQRKVDFLQLCAKSVYQNPAYVRLATQYAKKKQAAERRALNKKQSQKDSPNRAAQTQNSSKSNEKKSNLYSPKQPNSSPAQKAKKQQNASVSPGNSRTDKHTEEPCAKKNAPTSPKQSPKPATVQSEKKPVKAEKAAIKLERSAFDLFPFPVPSSSSIAERTRTRKSTSSVKNLTLNRKSSKPREPSHPKRLEHRNSRTSHRSVVKKVATSSPRASEHKERTITAKSRTLRSHGKNSSQRHSWTEKTDTIERRSVGSDTTKTRRVPSSTTASTKQDSRECDVNTTKGWRYFDVDSSNETSFPRVNSSTGRRTLLPTPPPVTRLVSHQLFNSDTRSKRPWCAPETPPCKPQGGHVPAKKARSSVQTEAKTDLNNNFLKLTETQNRIIKLAEEKNNKNGPALKDSLNEILANRLNNPRRAST